MKLNEIAAKINEYLLKFERNPATNGIDLRTGTCEFYYANAYSGGRYIYIKYLHHQGSTPLNKEQAEKYLFWLDAGNVGRHFEMTE